MKIIEGLQQQSPEWYEFRKNHIGASDAGTIMGVNPYRTPYKLWSMKMGLIPEEPTNDAMRRGVELEPVARAKFNEIMPFDMEPAVVVSDQIEYMASSLDGLSILTGKALEIKCPRGVDFDCAMNGKIPDKYYPQLQHQMFVTGLSSIYYFTFNPPQYKILICERDDNYIVDLLQKEKEFWKCLQNLEPPEMTNKDFVTREDLLWKTQVSKYRFAKHQMEIERLKMEEAKDALVNLAGSSATKGAGLVCSKLLRRGNVDYNSIPELKQVDLEKYRKPKIEYWRISNE